MNLFRRQPADIRVLATCPTCGNVETTLNQVTVQIYATLGVAEYRFVCPACQMTVVDEADRHVYRALAGATVVTIAHPAELDEPHPDGLPFTLNDVIDFHDELDQLR